MKALAVLGTSSSAGKSWVATALCAWLRQQGVRVAPFKAQNMSNNAWATFDGGEMARAQAVQAEACGLLPSASMNPLLLKPSGAQTSQVVVNGRAVGNFSAAEYYQLGDRWWKAIADALDGWRSACDVLVMEGAGSPVELNLMERDLVNLRPIRHVGGRSLLVGDIDRGGVFAQLAGTWQLLPALERENCLGAIVNKFRGDPRLFEDASRWLAPHAPGLALLGTLPMRDDLRPDEEDGLGRLDQDKGSGEVIAWIRWPNVANLTDCQPWWDDMGVRTRWVSSPADLGEAKVIVLPGTKNTIEDARWMRTTGFDRAILGAAERGVLVIGICGGYQLLGERLEDPDGVAGSAGRERGLGLLPVETTFVSEKIVRQVTVVGEGSRWQAYEVHMGRSVVKGTPKGLARVEIDGQPGAEGICQGNVWGTYLHGWFDGPECRRRVAEFAGLGGYRAAPDAWSERRQKVYRGMAEVLQTALDLASVRRYLGLGDPRVGEAGYTKAGLRTTRPAL